MRLFSSRFPSLRSFLRPNAGPGRSWLMRGILLAVVAVVPSFAANRTLKINPPTIAVAGTTVKVSVYASTDAGGGEHIGFFHGEFSTDGGKTWTAFCYEQNLGPTATRVATFTAGAVGSNCQVRVRIAYRGGKAGDIDYAGEAINWEGSWSKWGEPPAKSATVTVTAR